MGRFKINRQQLPVKAHYFFFMAAMGPILPFLQVYGKQMGVSALVMGCINAVLPLLYLLAKPFSGYLVDRFRGWRKHIFMGLLAATSGCFVLMYLLPPLRGPVLPESGVFSNENCLDVTSCTAMNLTVTNSCSDDGRRSSCSWNCSQAGLFNASMYFSATVEANISHTTSCFVDQDYPGVRCWANDSCSIRCDDSAYESECVYSSPTFLGFVVLMSFGLIGYNVCNSISDAVCFDVLGEGGQMSFGRQRVWGSIGFGIAALMAGYSVDLWATSNTVKSYTPAFALVFGFACVDLVCCLNRLHLPIMSSTDSIVKDVWELVKIKPISIFLSFATVVGILDSFVIFFLFWYMEDLAKSTGYTHDIKLIEGVTVFAETLGGEIIFFSLSGKILKKIGYGYSFVCCFAAYALRLLLISVAPQPWWIAFFELFMQGPTYALSYTTIVSYASVVAPPGTSATVQGIVAGIDDGLGFALGSFIGGMLYKHYSGIVTLRIFASLAATASIVYLITHLTYLRHLMPATNTRDKTEWKSPEEAAEVCVSATEK
ncbi:hypothetical protein TKK_0007056 [Trichogramma kaykai]|uniref:Major facilitator superfamily (MFS) profile domain-containing protein n=1 Tax=Trichogramma kaykai TaxID=54128 RepID=A0ABD2XAL3_9HYME